MNVFEVFKHTPGIFSENHHESALNQGLPNQLCIFYQPLGQYGSVEKQGKGNLQGLGGNTLAKEQKSS